MYSNFFEFSIVNDYFRLPIANVAGTPQIAETTLSGKKKEAIMHCALEACKILDMYGLLRQSTHGKKHLYLIIK